MTSLELELEKRKISYYKVSQFLGRKPQSGSSHYKKKIHGIGDLDIEDVIKICEKVTEMTGVPLELKDLNYKVRSIQLL